MGIFVNENDDEMRLWQKAMSDGSLSFLEFQDAIKLAENDVFQAREGREKRDNK